MRSLWRRSSLDLVLVGLIFFCHLALQTGAVLPCDGEWPSDCSDGACADYHVTWEWLDDVTEVRFTVTATQPIDTWVAIGFSFYSRMDKVDVILGYISDTGEGIVKDMWVGNFHNTPIDDPTSQLTSSSIVYNDGTFTMTFTRPMRATEDQDLALNEDIYFFYPVGGGTVVRTYGLISRHSTTPYISDDVTDFASCSTQPATQAPPVVEEADVTLYDTSRLGPFVVIECVDSEVVLECPQGYFLQFEGASYGRWDNENACTADGEAVTLTDGCLDTDVLSSLESACASSIETCSLLVTAEMFGDPCPEHTNYLNFTYSCQQQVFRGLTCEGSILSLECFGSDVINVQSVLYGRDNDLTCSHDTAILTTNCSDPVVPGNIASLCNSRTVCDISVSAAALGDPCPGTFKYLEISYTCSVCYNQWGDDDDCDGWAAEGYCASNLDWMYAYCRKSCTLCDLTDSCDNIADAVDCDTWALSYECAINPSWMNVNCQHSCNMCGRDTQPATTTTQAPPTTSWVPETLPADTIHQVSCTYEDMLLECSSGYIRVIDVYFGRNTNDICPSEDGTSLDLCDMDSSQPFLVAHDLCNGRSSCYLYVDDPPFDNTCTDETMNYLEVDYVCEPCSNLNGDDAACAGWADDGQCNANRFWMTENCFEVCSQCSRAENCENQEVDTACDYWASYGECGSNPVWMAENCQRSCRECEEQMTTTTPAPTTPAPTPEGTIRVLTCQQFEMELTCDEEDTHIRILSAFYGRLDDLVCDDGGANTTSCEADPDVSTAKAREVCDGRRTCYLRPLSPPFEDPCPESTKYLDVYYLCEPCVNINGDDDACDRWAATDECTINPTWMPENCFRSCSGCDSAVACENTVGDDSGCDYWASYGECVNNADWMIHNCQKSCRICDVTPTTVATTVMDSTSTTTTTTTTTAPMTTTTLGYTQIMACHRTEAYLTCPQDEYIRVTRTFYGRSDVSTCPGENATNIDCGLTSQDEALELTSTLCNGRQDCYIWVGSPAFAEVCSENMPYMELDYHCEACMDMADEATCEDYAQQGRCETNSTVMMEMCFATCSGCQVSEDCENSHPSTAECDFWASGDQDQCVLNADWMVYNCEKSCRQCGVEPETTTTSTTTSTTTTATTTTEMEDTTTLETTTTFTTVEVTPQPECFDAVNTSDCMFWASTGECDFNPLWMHRFCQYSCGCIGIGGGYVEACEGQSALMTCSLGYEIVMNHVTWGRQDNEICPHASAMTNITCGSETAMATAAAICDGLHECQLPATTHVFGDPCEGTYKYFTADYSCAPITENDLTACEGEIRLLTCPFNAVIVPTYAFYGRQNTSICEHETAMADMECSSSDILDDVTALCGSRDSCTLEVMVHVLGDPCPGTYKYLQLEYDCVSLCEPVCQYGVCIAENTCICDNGWGGVRCESFHCNDVMNCSSRGTCVGPNNCECVEGHTGDDCSAFSCVDDCSGHGSCVTANTCVCDEGYSGNSCSMYSCTDVQDCSGHGSCMAPNQCVCGPGYTGTSCADYICPDVGNCNGHGTCTGPNVCTCNSGYGGDSCESYTCTDVMNCMNQGSCVGPNLCSCNSGYQGYMCAEHSCGDVMNCNNHGACSGPNICTCFSGYTGVTCDQYNCIGVQECMQHGTCIGPDTCSCHTGYTGVSCNTVTCTAVNGCSGHGECIGPNTCNCHMGYTGASCSDFNCPGVPACSNQGECTGPNSCTCHSGYFGTACESYTCVDVMDCSGHGTCVGGNTCRCDEGWLGNDCSVFGDGELCSSLNNCNGHGVCVAANTCWCYPYYGGDDCSQCSINGIGQACVTCPPCNHGFCVEGDDADEMETYIGCYLDNASSRDLSHVMWTGSSTNTVRKCIENCYLNGYKYAGLQNGDSCYCGSSYGQHGTSSACGIACTGGEVGEICGGVIVNSIYMTYQGMCQCDGPQWAGEFCDVCAEGYTGDDCSLIETDPSTTSVGTTSRATMTTTSTTTSTTTTTPPSTSGAGSSTEEPVEDTDPPIITDLPPAPSSDYDTYGYMNLEVLVDVAWQDAYNDMGHAASIALWEDVKETLESMYQEMTASFTYVALSGISNNPVTLSYYLGLTPAIDELQGVEIECALSDQPNAQMMTTDGVRLMPIQDTVDVCSERPEYCENGGTLLRQSDGQFDCSCTEEYSGWRCSHKAVSQYIIIIVVVVSVVVSVLIILIVCCCLKGVCHQKKAGKTKKVQTHYVIPSNNGTTRSFQYHGMAKGIRGTKMVHDQERGISRRHADPQGYVPRQI